MATMPERVATLEANSATHDKQIDEIFRLIHVQQQANTDTARALTEMSQQVKDHPTPDKCPNAEKISSIDSRVSAIEQIRNTFALGWKSLVAIVGLAATIAGLVATLVKFVVR